MYGDVAHLRITNGLVASILPFLGIVAIAIGTVLWVCVELRPQELRGSGEQVAAEKWLVANVASEARVTADSIVTSDLMRAGFRRPPVAYVQIDVGGIPQAGSWRDFDYLVSTPSTRFDSTILPELERALTSSVVVAVFGTGPDRVEVRQILPRGTDHIDVRRSADARARQRAETALLHNRRVQVDLLAGRVLEAGGLDLRAATVLALMAHQALLRINAIDSGGGHGAPPADRLSTAFRSKARANAQPTGLADRGGSRPASHLINHDDAARERGSRHFGGLNDPAIVPFRPRRRTGRVRCNLRRCGLGTRVRRSG
jgi:hypothetical protein